MDQALLAFYTLTITAGGVATAAAFFLHARLRSSVTLAVTVVTTAFTGALARNVVAYYLQAAGETGSVISAVLTGVGVVLGLAVYGGVFAVLRAADGELTALHAAVAGVAIVSQVGRAIVIGLGMTRLAEAIRLPAIAMISLYLLYAGIVLWRARHRIESVTVGALLGRLGVVLMVFAPLSTGVYAGLSMIPPSFRPPVSLDYLLAIAWSMVLVTSFERYLRKPEVDLESGVSRAFLSMYGITEREAEVIEQVAQGKSNQQVADALFVSLSTVRTHLYNVFQKTGARNRVELLTLARSQPD